MASAGAGVNAQPATGSSVRGSSQPRRTAHPGRAATSPGAARTAATRPRRTRSLSYGSGTRDDVDDTGPDRADAGDVQDQFVPGPGDCHDTADPAGSHA